MTNILGQEMIEYNQHEMRGSYSKLVIHNYKDRRFLLNIPKLIHGRIERSCDYCPESIIKGDMYFKFELDYRLCFYFHVHRMCYRKMVNDAIKKLIKIRENI